MGTELKIRDQKKHLTFFCNVFSYFAIFWKDIVKTIIYGSVFCKKWKYVKVQFFLKSGFRKNVSGLYSQRRKNFPPRSPHTMMTLRAKTESAWSRFCKIAFFLSSRDKTVPRKSTSGQLISSLYGGSGGDKSFVFDCTVKSKLVQNNFKIKSVHVWLLHFS